MSTERMNITISLDGQSYHTTGAGNLVCDRCRHVLAYDIEGNGEWVKWLRSYIEAHNAIHGKEVV